MSDHESSPPPTDPNTPIRRSRGSGEVEVRFLIPSKNAGSVIGKGGTIISRLRSEYPASINIPDCPGPERVLTLCGPDAAVKKMVEEVVTALDESAVVKGEADMRMLVHQSQAGAIIGKGGAKIKDLRTLCGGIVKIFSNPCPQSTDRVVQLTGTLERVLLTLVNVIDSVKECPVKGGENNYNPFNCEEMFAHEYGGWGDPAKRGVGFMPGPPGPMPPKDPWARGPMGGAPMSGPPPPIGGANRIPIGPGGPMGGNMGGFNERVNDRRSNRSGGAPFSPPRNNNGDNSEYEDNKNYLNGAHSQSLMGTNSDNLTTTTQVTIPKDAAGAIIGKGGQRIRRIRHESCCAISIEDARPGSDDRIITITGSDQQIKHAQYLLQQSVREYGGGVGGGGDGERRNY